MVMQIQRWITDKITQNYIIHSNRISIVNEFGLFVIPLTPQNEQSISKSLSKTMNEPKNIKFFANQDFFDKIKIN